MQRPFMQVDVFTTTPYRGNPVAVVLAADGLTTEQMQAFAAWTNLSETTFVLPPTPQAAAAGADYRVRIFTPNMELPFAGHPTLGTCHAWLLATRGADAGADGEANARADVERDVIQECDAGLVPVRRTAAGLAFQAPPLIRSGPVDEDLVRRVVDILGIDRADVVEAQWADNGPGWVAILLENAEAVLAVRPGDVGELDIGIVGPHPAGSPEAFEVRAFFGKDGTTAEDPVTGSLNAALGQWLLASGRATSPYVAAQGTALGREGRVHVRSEGDGTVWVGGGTLTCISGEVDL